MEMLDPVFDIVTMKKISAMDGAHSVFLKNDDFYTAHYDFRPQCAQRLSGRKVQNEVDLHSKYNEQ